MLIYSAALIPWATLPLCHLSVPPSLLLSWLNTQFIPSVQLCSETISSNHRSPGPRLLSYGVIYTKTANTKESPGLTSGSVPHLVPTWQGLSLSQLHTGRNSLRKILQDHTASKWRSLALNRLGIKPLLVAPQSAYDHYLITPGIFSKHINTHHLM